MRAVYFREIKSYFTSPVGYVFLALYYFFFGLYFSTAFINATSNLSYVFSSMFSITLFVCPIITMKLLSEDKRQKTDQALLTAPASVTGIVLGKYFAAFTLYAIGIAISIIFQLIIAAHTSPDWMMYICNLLGSLLLAAAFLAIGLFVSALTESQMVAAVVTFFISLVLIMIDMVKQFTSNAVVGAIVDGVTFSQRFTNFTNGVLNYADIIFFVSIAAVFLFLTTRVLDKKRWA